MKEVVLRITCVHQGFELYGSDRSFATAVEAIRHGTDAQVKVVLPKAGPIDALFAHMSNDVEHRDLFVLRKADILKRLTFDLTSSIRAIFRARKTTVLSDVVYVNTCVILDFLLAGWLTRRRMIVHVREIPTGLLLLGLRRLLMLSGASLIFNSEATKKAFDIPANVPQAVVWNGFRDPGNFVRSGFDGARSLHILCIGRINGWKGQDDLIETCRLLVREGQTNLEIRVVGSVYEAQKHYLTDLESAVKNGGLSDFVSILPFVDDPSCHFEWADVVVVPSKTPEPFGRVAIEAMAYGCVVVGTAHGGLTEIVVNGKTGILVPPSNSVALKEAIKRLLNDPELVNTLGVEGRLRFENYFTETSVNKRFIEIFNSFSKPSMAPHE